MTRPPRGGTGSSAPSTRRGGLGPEPDQEVPLSRRQKPGRPAGTPAGRQSAREAYYRAQTRKVEQEIRARAGELVEVVAVDRAWGAMTLALRERLLALPTTARQRGLVDAAGEEAFRLLVEQALAELAAR